VVKNASPENKGIPNAAETLIGLLRQNTPVCFRAGGVSMNPVIRDGEPVQVRPVRPQDLRPGAVLLYLKNKRPVLHRLIHRDAGTGTLFFIGDAALSGEERIAEKDLLGTATSLQRAGRTIPLDTPGARLRGMLRYRLRPLRRLIWS
jgi:hypothetical protein